MSKLPQLRFLDASKLQIRFGMIEIKNLKKEDGWLLEPVAEDFDEIMGLHGTVVPRKSRDRRAILLLKLMKTSPVNQLLSAVRISDLAMGKNVFDISIYDESTGDTHYSTASRIVKAPPGGLKYTLWKFKLYYCISNNGGQSLFI